jgi:hypothetical protein
MEREQHRSEKNSLQREIQGLQNMIEQQVNEIFPVRFVPLTSTLEETPPRTGIAL